MQARLARDALDGVLRALRLHADSPDVAAKALVLVGVLAQVTLIAVPKKNFSSAGSRCTDYGCGLHVAAAYAESVAWLIAWVDDPRPPGTEPEEGWSKPAWQGEEVVHDAIRDVLLARGAPAHVAAVLRRLGAVSEEVWRQCRESRL